MRTLLFSGPTGVPLTTRSRSSIIVGEVFTKALRRKDQAGTSTVEESKDTPLKPTVEADGEETATPDGVSVPAIKLNGDAVEEADAAKELGAIEEELEKATSGKILNLISSDTYQRELKGAHCAMRSKY